MFPQRCSFTAIGTPPPLVGDPALRYADARRRPRRRPASPAPADVAEPARTASSSTVLACGLCGSDVEKIGVAAPGTVLGHEVVARTARRPPRRADPPPRAAARARAACAGHESTCEQFPEPTIVPGGFAERVRATGWVELPDAGRRCARDVRRAARLRPARSGAAAARARARRRQRVHRAALRSGARAARRHRVRGRPESRSGRAPRRTGRSTQPCSARPGGADDGARRGRARRDGAALRRRRRAARGRRCTGAS